MTAELAIETTESPDPFDPSRLRFDLNFQEHIGVKKLLTTVPVSRPNRQEFIRVNPDVAMRLTSAVLEVKEDGELYLVSPEAYVDLAEEVKIVTLFVYMNRSGVLKIMPVTMPGPDGKTNPWHESLMEAALIGTDRWVRIQANMQLGAYECSVATAPLDEPEWPDLEFKDILRIAFKDRRIDSSDHEVVRRLRGEV